MSAIAVLLERTGGPVDADAFERMMSRLAHHGPDGRDACLAGNLALGHWHFRAVPEEAGERQPVRLPGIPFTVALDGRLDNRPDLISALDLDGGSRLSDAALILHAYDRWGEQCFSHFAGDYAIVIQDERHGQLLCARDPLGSRTLFYSISSRRFVAASEPWAVAAVCGVAVSERAVADYFALRASEDGQSWFRDIYELPPGCALVIDACRARRMRFWAPDPSRRQRGRSDEEYAEEFRSLLEQSVRSRIRANAPVGVLMSGGLDSSTVACLAASLAPPDPITTISYVFDELKDCDERQYIDAVTARWGTKSIQIPCDGLWPLKDWENWPANRNLPEGNPYRLLKETAYNRARQEGLRILLTGGFGDELYSGEDDWLADLISEGRIRRAGRELIHQIRSDGLGTTLASGSARRVARRLLDSIPGGRRLRRSHRTVPEWLTPYAVECLTDPGPAPDPAFELKENILGFAAAQDCASEIPYASRCGIELRHPYRDQRLVEFVLSLPAHQFYNRGQYKSILRTAMRGILPEKVRTRTLQTTLVSLFVRGFEREKSILQSCFEDPSASWRNFVQPAWLLQRWDVPLTPETDTPEALVPWLCVCHESWYKSLTRSELSYS